MHSQCGKVTEDLVWSRVLTDTVFILNYLQVIASRDVRYSMLEDTFHTWFCGSIIHYNSSLINVR